MLELLAKIVSLTQTVIWKDKLSSLKTKDIQDDQQGRLLSLEIDMKNPQRLHAKLLINFRMKI